MAVKWKFSSDFSFEDKKFARIYRFFVIETPVDGVSARGKSFKSKGINMTSLNAAIKRETPFMRDNWFDEKVSDVEARCKAEKIFDNADMSREIVVHSINDTHCSGKTDSLFYAIRCALAHGSFSIHEYKGKNKNREKYYLLENKDKGKLKARLIVKEDTLIKWIEIVESVPRPKQGKAGK